MLDISRSMSKAYADLVSNFISTLTNLVLIRRDSYLHHAHPNQNAFRLRNLRAAPVSGGDLFERSLMQEYEQHLIGLGVKPGSKMEQCFHPYKKSKKGRGGRQKAPQGVYCQPMPAPQYMVQQPKVVTEEDVAVTEGAAVEAAQVVASSRNLLNDTQYHVLPSHNPGLKQIMPSGDPLHSVFLLTPPEGEKTLSVLTLPEREKTPCVQSPPEGGKTLCVQSQTGGRLSVYNPHQRRRKLCVYSLRIYPTKISFKMYIFKKRQKTCQWGAGSDSFFQSGKNKGPSR